MERLTAQRVNGIKSGYWSAAKKDELVQRLGKYEDTGLEPEEIQEMVERQRPKRPIKSDLDIEETVVGFYECPKCKGILCDIPGNRDKFCGESGQASQWDS